MLDSNYDGVMLLSYQVSDGQGGSVASTQSFTITIDTTGTAGADVLIGGNGDDTYVINHIRDVIIESANPSIDTVVSSLSYVLGDNLEKLTLIGNANLSGAGNTADNIIKGNEGNNRLLGGAGNDTLYGLSGGDTLNGGEGADVMYGGLGNDTFTVENVGDIVNEAMNEGFDTVNSFISYTLTANVERLMLEGLDNLNGFGNALDNTLNGNNANNSLVGGLGNDILQGKGGADTLEGGLDNDLYYVDNVGDVVTELTNEGTDKVSSSINYTLTANVEQLFLTGIAGLNGTGNSQNNVIYGNSGNNQLFGDVGNDSLNGGAGNDLLDGGLGLDTLVGGAGNDTYVLGINSNRDLINNNDATGNDKLLFDAGINADQVWLRQLGNDLEVSIMGTANSVKVQNWYSNTANQLDSLQLADGKTLLANEVQTLVEAMAAFAPPTLGQTSLTTAQHAVLDSVIAASW
jgi:Ca2+-binding RTX toxin-like protein